jgi:prepilin-type N-terminal cleavage/methylation domain-containing protein
MRITATIKGKTAGQRGFTIVEIIVAFIIIGILTAILTPTLAHRAAEARVRAATQDLEHLADAQERAAVDTGYMYRPYVLNDGPGPGDAGEKQPSAPKDLNQVTPLNENKIESIRDNYDSVQNNLYKNPYKIFITANGLNVTTNVAPFPFIDDTQQKKKFKELTGMDALSGSPDPSLAQGDQPEAKFNWNGPYLNWKRDANKNDWPDDPWGNDYLFFVPQGVLYPPDAQAAETTLREDKTFEFQEKGPATVLKDGSNFEFPAKNVFARPTWLSLGPNGVPGNGTKDDKDGYGKGDDIIRTFGGG